MILFTSIVLKCVNKNLIFDAFFTLLDNTLIWTGSYQIKYISLTFVFCFQIFKFWCLLFDLRKKFALVYLSWRTNGPRSFFFFSPEKPFHLNADIFLDWGIFLVFSNLRAHLVWSFAINVFLNSVERSWIRLYAIWRILSKRLNNIVFIAWFRDWINSVIRWFITKVLAVNNLSLNHAIQTI